MKGGGPVIPNFGGSAHALACQKANNLFCWNWFSSNWSNTFWPALRQHVVLVVVAVTIGFAIALALALLAHRHRAADQPIIAFTSFLYTIPSLAFFELLLGVPGLGLSFWTAEIPLIAYTLLILYRNILTGLRNVPDEVLDAARGMGMSRREMLVRVELPLALPAIIAGLRIATVSTVALGTIAALVDGNYGLGAPILSGIGDYYFKTELIAAGVLAVLLAVTADGLLVGSQRLLTPWTRMRTA